MGKLDKALEAAPSDRERKAFKERVGALERTIEDLERQLQDARRSKFSLPTGKPRPGSKKKGFCRVIVPDSHGCYIDPAACKAFLADLEQIQPAEIVMLGDHIDCGGFLAQHHTLSYIAQGEYSFEDDCNAANQFLDAIQQRAPGAEIHYLSGNHERRIESWIIEQTLRNTRDAKFLHSMFSAPAVLHLAERKIKYYPQGVINEGLTVPAILRLDKCCFTHGIYTCKNAAKAHVDEYVCNIVFGHTHRADYYPRRTATDTYAGWNPGCLCIQQHYYAHARNTHHTQGYAVQGVQSGDGAFLHLTIPIINGLSYLSPLASQLSK